MDQHEHYGVNEIVDAQKQYGDYEEALQKAMEMSLTEVPNSNEGAGDDPLLYEIYDLPPEMDGNRADDRARQPREEIQQSDRRNQVEEINIGDYDYDGIYEEASEQSERQAREQNRERNQRQNIRVIGHDFDQYHPDERHNDLLAELPDHRIRERLNDPRIGFGIERIPRYPDYRRERSPYRPREIQRRPYMARDLNPMDFEQVNRRSPENQNLEVDADNMNYEQLLELENNIGSVSKGYRQEEIEAIPITYSFLNSTSNCPICLDDIEDGTPILSIACRHEFHMECLKKSLEDNKGCPVCKADAFQLV
mmetsp:Transcript_24277/g.24203  ORF Transcript_24277/g.24203 Transcript_24277/m.24203 type:complete len:309 (-) Transcript_24277:55-981(-)